MPTQARDSGTVVLPLIAWPRFGGLGGEASFKVSPVSFSGSFPSALNQSGSVSVAKTQREPECPPKVHCALRSRPGRVGRVGRQFLRVSTRSLFQCFPRITVHAVHAVQRGLACPAGRRFGGARFGGDCHCNSDPYPPEAGGLEILTVRQKRLCSILTARQVEYHR